MSDVQSFVVKMKKAYGVELPARYRKFLDKKEYATLGNLKLTDGYLRGTFEVDFTDDLLTDLSALGEEHWIDDIDDVDWPGEFGDYVPFGRLTDAHGEEDEPVKSFLIVSVKDAACPVLVWDYDGWMIYPLAKSLDDFVDGIAKAGKLTHDRAGYPYKKFAWVEEDEDDEDTDENDDEDTDEDDDE